MAAFSVARSKANLIASTKLLFAHEGWTCKRGKDDQRSLTLKGGVKARLSAQASHVQTAIET